MKKAIIAAAMIVLIAASVVAAAFCLAYFAKYLDSILTSDKATVKQESEKTRIVLDAGHGGADGGANAGGIYEKKLNLEMAKQMEMLLTLEGIPVVMTRSEDIMLSYGGASSAKTGDLRARLEIAENSGECIFVSVHMNKFPQENVRGATLYYSPNNPQSKTIAELLRERIVKNTQPHNKRVLKEATSAIYILHRTTVPAVLIEFGFLSNPDEAMLLCTAEYQSRLSAVSASALSEHIGSDGAANG